jgi:hypothetical protein
MDISHFCIVVCKIPDSNVLREEVLFWLMVLEISVHSPWLHWFWARSGQTIMAAYLMEEGTKGGARTSSSWILHPPQRFHHLPKQCHQLETKVSM